MDKHCDHNIPAVIDLLKKQNAAGVKPMLSVRSDMWLCAGRKGYVMAVYDDGVALSWDLAVPGAELWRWHELDLPGELHG